MQVHGEQSGVYIKEAAAMVGVSPTVLRLWERHGLLLPRRAPSGYRLYSAGDVARARQARDLIQREGMSIQAVVRNLGAQAPASGNGAGAEPGHRLGDRLRSLRHDRETSLRDLADATGLSASYISALERSLASPSVASLQKLASGLGTNLVGLLGETDERDTGVVVPAEGRPTLDLGFPGVVIENLATTESVLEPLMFHVEPGASSDTSYSHRGDEFLFVLDGCFEVTLEETQVFRLEQGDSMTFASHRPHRWWNPGDRRAVVIWINTPPTF